MKKNTLRKLVITSICIFVLVLITISLFIFNNIISFQEEEKGGVTLTIAIKEDTKVSNINTNYYKEWLEKHTGYTIEFEFLPKGLEKEYLSTMLTSDYNKIDAVFLSKDEEIFEEDEFESFMSQGLMENLNKYITDDSNLKEISKKYGTNQKELYFFPTIDTSRKAQNMQVMWINIMWLKKLGLKVPTTTEELSEILQKFKNNDPNGNGLYDELPLVSCGIDKSLCSFYYLINAYTYYNPSCAGICKDEDGKIIYTPITQEFRKALQYISSLYDKDYLSKASFSYSKKQLMELVSTPENLVGAFTSQSIADVIYSNCPDILSRYIQVAPLKNESGDGVNAVKIDYKWNVGGYIPANSQHKEEAFRLMDLMLSQEASLIAQFGEEGVNWRFSEKGDLSIYGTSAKIATIDYLKDTIQNKNFAGAGPSVLREEYSNGVTWNGDNSLIEYIDGRAVKAYEPFYGNDAKLQESDELNDYTNKMLERFVTGKINASDDAVWNDFCKNYINLSSKVVNKG